MSHPPFDLIIIGAGPGGYVAAIRAAQLGMRVACVEKEKTLGGTCLNVGCIPSKALLESSELYAKAKVQWKSHGIEAEKISLDFKRIMERKDQVVKQLTDGVAGLLKKNKVQWIQGTAQLQKDKTVVVTAGKEKNTFSAKNILIATGSKPITLPHLKIDQTRIIDSTGALALQKIPKRLAVIGGGYIGLELGSVYRRLGSEVRVIEMLDRILPGMDEELAKTLHRFLKKQGMEFRLSSKVDAAISKGDAVHLKIQGPEGEEEIVADTVLVAVGRRPNTEDLGLEAAGIKTDTKGRITVGKDFATSVPGIYAIGDVIRGLMLAHKASEEGIAVVETLAGKGGHVNYHTIPSIIYTYPEVASVGLTEEECKELGIELKKFRFPFSANGRALSLGETEGWAKLLAHPQTDRLLGAHIIGPRASEMIAELVLAMEYSASAGDIARTVHAHPTLSEVIHEAAWGLGPGAIHS